MIPFTAEAVCHDPADRASAPWRVSIASEQEMLAVRGQVYDLTQIRGYIECPDKETADEIIRRLTGPDSEGDCLHCRMPVRWHSGEGGWVIGRHQSLCAQSPSRFHEVKAKAPSWKQANDLRSAAAAIANSALAAEALLRAEALPGIREDWKMVARARAADPAASWTGIAAKLGLTKDIAASRFRRLLKATGLR